MIRLKKPIVYFLMSFLFFYNCSGPTVSGVYVTKHNKNILDTLIIMENGKYSQKIYSTYLDKTVFKNEGEWKYLNNRLILNNFIPNNDQPIKNEKVNLSGLRLTCSFDLSINQGVYCLNYLEEKGHYEYEQQ